MSYEDGKGEVSINFNSNSNRASFTGEEKFGGVNSRVISVGLRADFEEWDQYFFGGEESCVHHSVLDGALSSTPLSVPLFFFPSPNGEH